MEQKRPRDTLDPINENEVLPHPKISKSDEKEAVKEEYFIAFNSYEYIKIQECFDENIGLIFTNQSNGKAIHLGKFIGLNPCRLLFVKAKEDQIGSVIHITNIISSILVEINWKGMPSGSSVECFDTISTTDDIFTWKYSIFYAWESKKMGDGCLLRDPIIYMKGSKLGMIMGESVIARPKPIAKDVKTKKSGNPSYVFDELTYKTSPKTKKPYEPCHICQHHTKNEHNNIPHEIACVACLKITCLNCFIDCKCDSFVCIKCKTSAIHKNHCKIWQARSNLEDVIGKTSCQCNVGNPDASPCNATCAKSNICEFCGE